MTTWEIIEDDDEMRIIESGSLEKGHGWHSYVKVCGDVDDVKNANIIAAAPELLAVLSEIMEALTTCGFDGDVEQRAKAAINKALGR